MASMAKAESPTGLSTVVLFGKGLTPGKYRGLQRISNPNGTLTMVALDQNSSMIEMATKALKGKGHDREPTYEEIVEAKLDLAKHLSTGASGVLIDAYYGAWSSVAAGAIGPNTGLLIRVEMSGSPKNKVGAPLGLIEPGWSVEKIKRLGADAVKLLAQFEPTEPHSAEHQFQLIEHVYDECIKHDILLLLETVAFPFGDEKKTDASFLNRKAATVIESAVQLSRFCDIYKAEFPGTMGHESDKQLRDNLAALNSASERPWVLLSAGVDYPDYYKQVQMALSSGASGVLGGRAFWKEYFLQDGAEARSQFAGTTAHKRVADVDALVREHGTPWYSRYGLTKEKLATVRATEGWHARYGSPLGSAKGASSSKGAPGEVY
jgi:tagatose 1,6-diphosphate aldolase